MRTTEEKQIQIDGLKAQKERLPEFSMFGDENWAAIDAMISIVMELATYKQYKYECYFIESEAYRATEWLAGNDDEDLFDKQ